MPGQSSMKYDSALTCPSSNSPSAECDHVTCYTTSSYVIHFKGAPSFGEAQGTGSNFTGNATTQESGFSRAVRRWLAWSERVCVWRGQ
jgi:hypothetical protein